MTKGCAKVFTSVLNDCTTATLEHLLYFCIHTMIDTSHVGVSMFGYKIFLQLLARNNPDIVVSKLSQVGITVFAIRIRTDRPEQTV